MYNMRFFYARIVLVVVGLMFACRLGMAQTSTIDSLQTLIKSLPNSQLKVNALNQLSVESHTNDVALSMRSAKQALALAQQLDYASGERWAWFGVGRAYQMIDKNDSCQLALNQAIELSQKAGDQKLLYRAYLIMANRFFDGMRDMDSSLIYYKKAEAIARKLDHDEMLAGVTNNMARVYQERADHQTALNYYLKSLALYEKTNNREEIAIILGNIGNVNADLGFYDKAIEYYQQAIEVSEAANSYFNLAHTYANMGVCYKGMVDYPKALECYDKSIALCEKYGYNSSLAQNYMNRANIEKEIGNYSKALNDYQQSIKICREFDLLYGVMINLANMGDLYTELGQYKQAASALEKSLEMANAHQIVDILPQIYELFYNLHKKKGDYKKALKYYEIKTELNDSIFGVEKTRQMAELQTKYESAKKQQQIELQENQLKTNEAIVKAQDAELVQHRTQRTAFVIGLLFLVLLSTFIFWGYRQKQKHNLVLADRNIYIQQQKEELEVQAKYMEEAYHKLKELSRFKEGMTGMIVHDLKNPLNLILNVSDSYPLQKQLDIVRQSSRQMLTLVTNILDVQKYENQAMSLQPDQNVLIATIDAAVEQTRFLYEPKNIQLQVDVDPRLRAYFDADIIERVYINLLTNAFKYTPNNSLVVLKADIEAEHLKLSVSDSGEGIPPDKLDMVFNPFGQVLARQSGLARSTGIGLTFCKLSIEAHGGKIGVNSVQGQGTVFYFTLPKPMIDNNLPQRSSIVYNKPTLDPKQLLLPADRQKLGPYVEKLRALEIYQISELKAVIKAIEGREGEPVTLWRRALQDAIFTGNTSMYHELLDI